MTQPSGCIEIALVNNMPDAALEATERHFGTLISSAADDLPVRLTLFALPDVPRSPAGRAHVSRYDDLDALWNRRFDGLIVTGCEPRAVDLRDEPYWASLTELMEWAEHETSSSIWSCLAAHAGVLYADGIHRHRLAEKRFGVFDSTPASEHSLMNGLPDLPRMPHSRWNDLPESSLVDAGYDVLTRSDAGVDAFAKRRRSLFVFFQGHPEYEADTLLLEYRRDIRRFLAGERETYPTMPSGYFDQSVVDTMARLEERARRDPLDRTLADFPVTMIAGHLSRNWGPAAICFYRNWMSGLRDRKTSTIRPMPVYS
jgi:homoserine O-succinyltransferase